MKTPLLSRSILGGLAFLLPFSALAQTVGQYGETFQSYPHGTTTQLNAATGELFSNQLGTAAMVKDNTFHELLLTADGIGFTNTAFRLPDLNPGGGPITAFSAKWNATIYGSQSAGLADGFSFNFGQLGGLTGSQLVNGGGAQDGFGVGLSVGLRTWSGATPGYYIRVNGTTVPNGFAAKASSAWGDLNTTRHFFEVDWRYDTGLTLRVDGTTIFSELPTPGFVPQAGDRFVFGGHTGGLDEECGLDNIVIFTGGVLTKLTATAPYYANAQNLPNEGAAQAFDGNANTKWLGAASTGYIGASLSVPRQIVAYTLTSANDSLERDPVTWEFQTGEDGIFWNTRNTQVGQYFQGRFEPRAFVVANAASNAKFRINITANRGAPETQLAEFQPWEVTPVSFATALTVTSAADSGPGSLRNAIAFAAANPGVDTFTFDSSLSGQTISLSSGLVINTGDVVTLDASSLPGGLTISGNNVTRIFTVNSSTLSLIGLTLRGGNAVGTTDSGRGGAIYGNVATLTLDRCTLTANSATGDGGAIVLSSAGSLALTNCTLAGNTSGFRGGAIFSQAPLTLTHCTLSGNGTTSTDINNSGGGGLYGSFAAFTLRNSIIAGNTVGPGVPNGKDILCDGGSVTRVGGNLVQNYADFGTTTGSGPAFTNAAPNLGALASNGGPTKTMALLPGSPAIDAAGGSTTPADQRGITRPQGAAADIGAYELNEAPTFPTPPANQTVMEGTTNLVVPFTVADRESSASALTMVELRKNGVAVPGTTFGGSGTNRTVTVPGPLALIDNGASFTVVISDGISSSTASFIITVFSDTSPPTITAPANMSVAATSSSGAVVTFALSATDNVGVTSLTASPASGSTFPIGTTTVTITAMDFAGNTATASFTVTVGIQVSSAADSGAGSLRDVLVMAAARPGADIITFAPALSGTTITLGSELVVTDPGGVTIDGSAATGGVTISGGGSNRLFSVNSGNSLTLKSLTLTGGNGVGTTDSGQGGAITCAGTLVAENCTFTGNTANTTSGAGGVVYGSSGSTLILTRCTFRSNTAYEGGAIRSSAGAITATHCTFWGNSASIGGACSIADGGPTAVLGQCTVTGNTATGLVFPGPFNVGGGGFFFYGKDATIANCIIAGNSSPTGFGVDMQVFGGVFSLSRNLVGNNDTVSSIFPAGPLTGSSAAPLDPLLAPLANYGGPTPTMPPLPGSTAIDAGGSTTETTDQRGAPRVVDGDGNGNAIVDIGAVEFTPAIVTSATDSGAGSLRAALADPFTSTVFFAPALSGQTITLTSGQLTLSRSVIIDASAVTGGITISGNSNGDNVLDPNESRIFDIPAGVTVVLRRLNLINGVADPSGAFPNSAGGAIRSAGQLTVDQCSISACRAEDGAGLAVTGGSATLTRSTLAGNSASDQGGGIFNEGMVTLTQSTFSGNSASFDGGGIYNQLGDTATVTQSTLSGNSAAYGGGIFNYGTLTLTRSIVAGNTAIFHANIRTIIGIFTGSNNLTDGDPLLAPLGNYGGPTQTMALKPGSPARDAAAGSTITSDQRGFPIVGTPDIGAYEAGTFTDFDAWAWETLPASATPAQLAAGFDYDGDGRPLLLEYAGQFSPTMPEGGNPLGFTLNPTGTLATIVMPYRYSAPDLLYTIERSTTLTGAWTSILFVNSANNTVSYYVSGLDLVGNGATTVTFTDTFITGQPRVFYRVVVTKN